MRTIIDLPADQLAALADVCTRDGISRAEAIRRAVGDLLDRERRGDGGEAFGLWQGRPINSLAEQRRQRREWDPPSAPRRRKRR